MPALVSVIIPCWNAETWIAETIASVLSQQGADFEIIVVDDGSADKSVTVARAAGDARLHVIQQENQGASHARNVGTAAAHGEFLQYLDADDLLMPGALRDRVAALTASGADVAYSDWVRWTRQPDGTFAAGATVARTLGARPDVDLMTDFWWPPGALMYRRSLVDRMPRWRDDLPIIQDARFQLDAALSGARFERVPRMGMKYREHGPGSLSRRDPRAFLNDCYRNATGLEDLWRTGGSLDADRRAALVKVYGSLARSFFPLDRAQFRAVTTRVLALAPDFLPGNPPVLRHLAGLIGYRRAEHLAGWWRQVRSLLGSKTRGHSSAAS